MRMCRVVAASYHGAVTQEREGRTADPDTLALLAAAKQFRDAASSAGRPDVVAKIDEANPAARRHRFLGRHAAR